MQDRRWIVSLREKKLFGRNLRKVVCLIRIEHHQYMIQREGKRERKDKIGGQVLNEK